MAWKVEAEAETDAKVEAEGGMRSPLFSGLAPLKITEREGEGDGWRGSEVKGKG